jgi:transposase
MNVHKNARLTPYRRGELVQRADGGEPVPELARQFGISLRTTRKWLARYRLEGWRASTIARVDPTRVRGQPQRLLPSA